MRPNKDGQIRSRPWGPEGWGREPRKGGARRVGGPKGLGARRVGGPKGWGPEGVGARCTHVRIFEFPFLLSLLLSVSPALPFLSPVNDSHIVSREYSARYVKPNPSFRQDYFMSLSSSTCSCAGTLLFSFLHSSSNDNFKLLMCICFFSILDALSLLLLSLPLLLLLAC